MDAGTTFATDFNTACWTQGYTTLPYYTDIATITRINSGGQKLNITPKQNGKLIWTSIPGVSAGSSGSVSYTTQDVYANTPVTISLGSTYSLTYIQLF